MATETATRKDIVRRINAKLAPTHFLVSKRKHGAHVCYCLATGDPMTARYEVLDRPVDVVDTAFRVGVHLTAAEIDALTVASRAA